MRTIANYYHLSASHLSWPLSLSLLSTLYGANAINVFVAKTYFYIEKSKIKVQSSTIFLNSVMQLIGTPYED